MMHSNLQKRLSKNNKLYGWIFNNTIIINIVEFSHAYHLDKLWALQLSAIYIYYNRVKCGCGCDGQKLAVRAQVRAKQRLRVRLCVRRTRKFLATQRLPLTIVLIQELHSTMVNGTLLNSGERYEDDLTLKGHFWWVAKVALRLGCAKQSKNLERYLVDT